MLRFSLDRALPGSGEVLPVLSLPAKVVPQGVQHSGGAGSRSGSNSGGNEISFPNNTISINARAVNKSVAYERVIELCRDVHATCVRQIPLSHTSTTTTLTTTPTSTSTSTSTATATSFSAYALESPGYLGIAGKVWDSMYVLLQYLALHEGEYVRGKRIVELGCGTGLAGEWCVLGCWRACVMSVCVVCVFCVCEYSIQV